MDGESSSQQYPTIISQSMGNYLEWSETIRKLMHHFWRLWLWWIRRSLMAINSVSLRNLKKGCPYIPLFLSISLKMPVCPVWAWFEQRLKMLVDFHIWSGGPVLATTFQCSTTFLFNFPQLHFEGHSWTISWSPWESESWMYDVVSHNLTIAHEPSCIRH